MTSAWELDKKRGGLCPPYQYWLRKAASSSGLIRVFSKVMLRGFSLIYNVEISEVTAIGGGLYIGHPYGITINSKVRIGKNCNIHKGVTIGQENRGARKGTPTIGDQVWIGVNATVVGNITIGNDVLIAPNSYVNCDIPSHSIVFGNPCIIKHREGATDEYINNIV